MTSRAATRRRNRAGGKMVKAETVKSMATPSKFWPIVTVPIENESDVVAVRQRAHRIAELLGFDRQDQTRIATAVSELARNAYGYAGGGRAEFILDPATTPQRLRDPHQRTRARASPICRAHPGRPVSLAKRHGPWPGRRAPPDGYVSRSTRSPARAPSSRSATGCRSATAPWPRARADRDRRPA